MPIRALKLLTGFLRPYPWILPLVALVGTVASLAEGVGIGLLIPFLTLLMQGATPEGGIVARVAAWYASLFDQDVRLIVVSVSIILLVVGRCLLNFAYVGLLAWAGTRVTHDLRGKLFQHFLAVDYLSISREMQGRQINALDGSCYRVGQAVMDFLLMVVNACTTLVFVVLLALISWQMTVLTLAAVLVAALATRALIKRSSRTGEKLEQGSALLNETAVQALNSMRMIRIFGQEAREYARFVRDSGQVRKAQFRLEAAWRTMQPLVDLLYVPLLLGILVIAWYANVGLAVLLPFLFLVFRLQRYVSGLRHVPAAGLRPTCPPCARWRVYWRRATCPVLRPASVRSPDCVRHSYSIASASCTLLLSVIERARRWPTSRSRSDGARRSLWSADPAPASRP